LSAGTHAITASVTDANGAPGSDQITVTVNANTPPVVAISAPADASTAVLGDTVTFAGSATDVDDGDLTASLSWESSLDGTIGSGAGFSTAGLSLGTHTITASLTDAHGAPGSDQITLTINPNTPPVVTISAPADGTSATQGDVIAVAGSATDAEDGDVTAGLSWESSLDGTIGSGAGFSTSVLSLGTHTITASLTDAHGAPGSDQITLTINPNTPPVVSITSPANGSSATQGSPVAFSGSATDSEDGDLTASLSWESDLDGSIGSGAGFSILVLSAGTHTITASLTDAHGAPGSDQITLIINPNTSPVVTISAPADASTAVLGDTVTFAGSANDAEDGDLTASRTPSRRRSPMQTARRAATRSRSPSMRIRRRW
jgi:hypothetical protein